MGAVVIVIVGLSVFLSALAGYTVYATHLIECPFSTRGRVCACRRARFS